MSVVSTRLLATIASRSWAIPTLMVNQPGVTMAAAPGRSLHERTLGSWYIWRVDECNHPASFHTAIARVQCVSSSMLVVVARLKTRYGL